jgi:hypothetical protein
MIEKLTPEQEALIPGIVAKYVKIGLSTERIDQAAGEAYAKKLFKFLERKLKKVEFATGPLDTWKKVLKDVGAKPDEKVDFVWPYLDGQFFAHYAAWTEFLRAIGQELPDTSVIDDHIIFGPVYPLETTCIICDRMSVCNVDARGNLHKDGGTAVEYLDGFKLWALNGVRVPQWLAETPEERLDPAAFAKIENVEIRREFVRKIGIERLVSKLGAKAIDKDGDYEILEVDLKPPVGMAKYLRMKNPSLEGVFHLEGLPPAINTVRAALAFRNSIPEEEFVPPEVLT